MKVSLEEIMAARSVAGGWSAATLATWGVPWPPPRGWKEALIAGRDPGVTLQDKKSSAPASNNHTEVCAAEKNQEEIPMPLKIGEASRVMAYADAYALVDLFVRRIGLKTVKSESYDLHVNRFVSDGANEIAISIYNTGALTVATDKGTSPLRSALLAFVEAVGSKAKKISTDA